MYSSTDIDIETTIASECLIAFAITAWHFTVHVKVIFINIYIQISGMTIDLGGCPNTSSIGVNLVELCTWALMVSVRKN